MGTIAWEDKRMLDKTPFVSAILISTGNTKFTTKEQFLKDVLNTVGPGD